MTVKEVLAGINQVYSDTSVDQKETLKRMREIEEAVQENIAALKDEMSEQGVEDDLEDG